MIFGMVTESLKSPADPSKRGEVKMSNEQVIGLIEDRTQKMKIQQLMEPTGQFGDYHIAYLKGIDDDLRNHYAQFTFGTVDGLQVILFMSGHTDRHVQQMHEVMSDPNFP